MSASLMVVVLLVLFLFIPACIALFMSGRSLLLILLGGCGVPGGCYRCVCRTVCPGLV